MEALRFDGDVAVVTGAGSGLGRGYAIDLAARGASVVCNDLVDSAARSTAEEINSNGGTAVPETSSVATPDGGAAIVQKALDSFGSLSIVINNAGQLRSAPFEDMSVEDFDELVDTHLAGAFYVTQPAFRHMKSAGYGRVVFTSSSSGVYGSPWAAGYGAAKTGLLGLSNVVSLEGANHGIQSNVVMPQALDTGMSAHVSSAPYPDDYLVEILEAFKPFAQHTTVDNVTPLVTFLAHRSCQLSQQIFTVGCGHVSRVFVGTTPGWFAPDLTCSSAEEVAAHLDQAADSRGFRVLNSAAEELRFMAENIPD